MRQFLHILTAVLIGTAFSACDNSATQQRTAYIPKDTTTSFKIDNYWLTPKKSFDFNSLGKISRGDTLHLVTCSDYVYFPFGKLTDKSSLQTSLLKDFTVTNFKRDTFTNTNMNPPFFEWSESADLQFGDNKLNLFLDNDPEASTHGYIRGGHIVDSKVILSDSIKIGMSTQDFYKKFFDYFPTELSNKYKVVLLESCVTDIVHIYDFDKGGELISVKFIQSISW